MANPCPRPRLVLVSSSSFRGQLSTSSPRLLSKGDEDGINLVSNLVSKGKR